MLNGRIVVDVVVVDDKLESYILVVCGEYFGSIIVVVDNFIEVGEGFGVAGGWRSESLEKGCIVKGFVNWRYWFEVKLFLYVG